MSLNGIRYIRYKGASKIEEQASLSYVAIMAIGAGAANNATVNSFGAATASLDDSSWSYNDASQFTCNTGGTYLFDAYYPANGVNDESVAGARNFLFNGTATSTPSVVQANYATGTDTNTVFPVAVRIVVTATAGQTVLFQHQCTAVDDFEVNGGCTVTITKVL